MAFRSLIIVLVVLTIGINGFHDEFETDSGNQKAMAAEKDQKNPRSAHPGREKGSFQKLHSLMNRTSDRKEHRRKGKDNLNKILELNRKHKVQNDNMMNDNEGSVIDHQKFLADNDTNAYTTKLKELRPPRPNYEAFYNSAVPQVTGVLCTFEPPENKTDIEDMCMWTWNTTVSKYSLGFEVMSADDIIRKNETAQYEFTGPTVDADKNEGGHFLYLPVDPSMENMVIKSPPFRGLREECKFEASFHQSRMQNASIRLISESTSSGMQWILMEVAGNNFETWQKLSFLIGKVRQEVRIIIEITRPSGVSLAYPLPHIAVDNIRMPECLPETPQYNGQCPDGHVKCLIMNRTSCIKQQQICDLVKDCDDGSDENQNCDKMPFGSYCNFENDLCGFVNVPQPILAWSRHSGPTPTDKTGPNYDHTCGEPEPRGLPRPPLAPAHLDRADPKCAGYYLYVNMNVTGPNKEKADFASTAIVRSATFNPPPKLHGDINSKHYNCCMIRFYYQQNGRNYGSLSVDLYEISVYNRSIPLWFSTKDKGEKWHRAAIFLPNITRRYYLEFKTRMGMRIYSDSAIDDFSLAPECFGLNLPEEELGDYNYYEPALEENVTAHYAFKDAPVYRFTSCGASGRRGPNQASCDSAYNGSLVKVLGAPLAGVQAWSVPQEGYYTIIAVGASGGYGSAWAGASHGAAARGLFELHRGETLYMMIGQQGQHACKKTLSAQESQACSMRTNDTSLRYTSKAHEVRNTEVRDGGGGGGGGTFVFLMDKANKLIPLLIAGGGGGLSVGALRDSGAQHGRAASRAAPAPGGMSGEASTAGAGAGWLPREGPITPVIALVAGKSPMEGGEGGAACTGGAHGGFGGGGGGCRRGGGGGGWIGGSTNEGLHGGGGHSYVSAARAAPEFSSVATARRAGHGEVLIVPALHACGCAYRCVALDQYRSEVRCFCPSQWTSRNGTGCILDDDWPRLSWLVVFVLSAVFLVFVVIVMIGCLYLYNMYQKKKEAEALQKHSDVHNMALRRLRHEPAGVGSLAAFNVTYGAAPQLPPGLDALKLPPIERKTLHLLKALGQGAFGEVYQGLYSHREGESPTPVAIKTLPELSTEQAESDFFMEAAIMAKFSHPNIVHLIGVCFDSHPRFIVLELLAGGDLKIFLRESRPRPERASTLTMKELLMCAVDVCKGCRYLESKRFIHRDIAARNCLLTTRGPGRVVKIADFGMARDIYRADYYKKGGKAMLPIKWMPPEAYLDGLFTVKTDVWSFGVLVWEVFSLGIMPYTGCTNREVMDMVSGGGRLDKPDGCPQEIYRLMCECWNPTPEDRPSFAHMFDKLTLFLQDPEIMTAPLPVSKSLLTMAEHNDGTHSKRPPPCDYLVPLSPHAASRSESSTGLLAAHSSQEAETPDAPAEDSLYQHHLKVSQDYGNIQAGPAGRGGGRARAGGRASDDARPHRPLQSNSTDRLLSSVECGSGSNSGSASGSPPPRQWETSFVERPPAAAAVPAPAVDKLISITPTSPKPPENVLTMAIDSSILDKTNKSLAPNIKNAPIASPDPPRINAWVEQAQITSKPKPLCLDAAQLEQNLNALKKNSGSVNLNTMNILPPYINVVTPKKLSESKTIQIDPKKAVIYDLQSPNDEPKEEGKLKQSNSAASLLNGPMTDVPYADSDNNTSSSCSSNPPNHLTKIQKSKQNNYSEVKVGVSKQNSNGGDFHDSEISC